ncbi:MAG: class I SAM-dependent methyltransferase [Bacteroidota bacterium]|jgi:SAM-dependent methyltransferase
MGKFNSYDRIADLYDHYVTVDYDLDFWHEECISAGEVLEVTAGTGRVTLPLLRAGLRVTAVDISFGLLKKLREKAETEGLAVETVHADMRDFDLQRTFPLIIIAFQSLEELADTCDVTAALRRVHAHLAPGGRAIVTLHHPSSHTGGDMCLLRLMADEMLPNGNRMLFWHTRKYEADTRTGISYQLYEEYDVDGLLHRKRLFTPRYHLLDRPEFEELANRAGLRVSNAWGGYKHEPYSEEGKYMIFELKE